MSSLIKYFVSRSFVVNLISVMICVIGFIVMSGMQRDLIPSMQFKIIQIYAALPGASAIDMEKNVTFPIEEAINNYAGIERIDSTTSNGSTQITLSFLPDYKELSEAVEDIKARVDSIQADLPQDLEPVSVKKLKIDSVPFLGVGFFGVDEKSTQDRSWLRSFEDRMRKIPGIVSVDIGVRERQIQIDFDTKKIERNGLSVNRIRSMVASALAFAPVGQIKGNEKNIAIELKKGIDSIRGLSELPIVSNKSGYKLLLKDVADVHYGFTDRSKLELIDGEPYISVMLNKDLDSDAINLRNEVSDAMLEYRKKLPEHLKVDIVGDGPKFIEKQLDVLKANGLTGMVLVVLCLFLFLGFRISMMTALGIPMAYLGTFIVLDYLGVSIDLISIVGMILVIGILVDDAIIVAEKYVQNLENGMKPRDAAFDCARSTIIPVTGTVITTVVAFAPILMIDSSVRTVLYAIPVVIISALALSWFESFFVLPNHLQHFVKTKSTRSDNLVIRNLRDFYKKALAFSLRWRYIVIFVFMIFTVFSLYWGGTHLEKDFSLKIGTEKVEISAVLKKSDSLEATAEALKPLTDFIRKSFPKEEVQYITTVIGSVRLDHRTFRGYRFARIDVEVSDDHPSPKQFKKKLKEFLTSHLQKYKTDDFESLDFRSVQSGSESSKDDVITVFVSGGDQLSFEDLQNEIQSVLKNKEHIQTLPMAEDRMQKSWQFYVDKAALNRYQIDDREVIGQLSEFFSPQELTQVRLQGESLSIVSKSLFKEDIEFSHLNSLNIVSPKGISVPITRLGKWKEVEVLKSIAHKNLLRKFEIDVKYDQEKTSKDDVAASVKESIAPLVEKYPSYNFTVLKEDEQTQRNMQEMIKIAITCLIMILMVLALTLNSLVQPIIVGCAIPFGVIGIIWAHYFHGNPMGLMAIIGLVGMAGVVVNDSLIMVDSINELKAKGQSLKNAIIGGASSRLRSIILTTITTLGGVFPMAYGIGGESGFTQPLAFSMGWGLTFATFLTLFMLPAMLAIHGDIEGGIKKLLSRFKLKRS